MVGEMLWQLETGDEDKITHTSARPASEKQEVKR